MPRVQGSRLSAPDAFAVTSPRADPRQPPALAHVRRFRLRRLKHEIRAAIAEGLTPLVLDASDDHVVDTFFSYSADAIVLDAKKMSLDATLRKQPDRAALDAARKRVVLAMKNGSQLVVATQQAAVDFVGRFSAPDLLPIELFAAAGKGFVNVPEDGDGGVWGLLDRPRTSALFRPADTVDTAGLAVCRRDFALVVTSRFSAESADHFLFREGYGLPARDSFRVLELDLSPEPPGAAGADEDDAADGGDADGDADDQISREAREHPELLDDPRLMPS